MSSDEDDDLQFAHEESDELLSMLGVRLKMREIGKPKNLLPNISASSNPASFSQPSPDAPSNSSMPTSSNKPSTNELFQGKDEAEMQSMEAADDKTLETNNEKLDPNEKSIVKGNKPFLMVIFGKPGEGKSALAQYVVYEKFQQKAVDYVMVISNSSFNDDWKFLPPKAIKKVWSLELARQIKEFQSKKGRGHLLVVLEDPVGSFPWEDKLVLQMIIMHRHLNTSWIINVQYISKLPPIYREVATYVAIFKQQTEKSKEALFMSYGGDFGNKKEFYELLRKSTGDYYFLFFEAPFGRWSKTKIVPIPKNSKINF